MSEPRGETAAGDRGRTAESARTSGQRRSERTRRGFLGAVGAATSAVLAGCWGSPPEYVECSRVDREELARRVAVTGHERDRLVETLAADGVATVAESEPQFPDGGVVESAEGRYYELERTVVNERWTAHAFGFETATESAADSPIDAAELPATDQSVLEEAFPAEDGTVELTDGTAVAARATRVEHASERDQSTLLDAGGQLLAYDGETYRIHVRTQTVAPGTHRYTATEVAADAAAYGEHLEDEAAAELQGLSEAERELVEEAIGGRADRDDHENDVFDEVVDQIQTVEPVDGDEYRGSWIVRYDGTTYWAEVERY